MLNLTSKYIYLTGNLGVEENLATREVVDSRVEYLELKMTELKVKIQLAMLISL